MSLFWPRHICRSYGKVHSRLLPGRLIRLIPESPPGSETSAIKGLVNHRLPSSSPIAAYYEWLSVVDGTSWLWENISLAKKELIRSFLNLVNMEILKRARPPTTAFDFSSASVGNLFLTGARIFSGSLESAIYLMGIMCMLFQFTLVTSCSCARLTAIAISGSVPIDRIRCLPAINTNVSHHISVSLQDGTVIVGQNSISHPGEESPPEESPDLPVHRGFQTTSTEQAPTAAFEYLDSPDSPSDFSYQEHELPGTLPSLRRPNVRFNKEGGADLPCRITRLWYINPYGQEIRPPANPRVIEAVHSSQAIVYSIGSLYTSILPNIVLPGVGKAIATCKARQKILILNGSIDRETGPLHDAYTALDFVDAIVKAGAQSRARIVEHAPALSANLCSSGTRFRGSELPPLPDTSLTTELPYSAYVTHLMYLEGPQTPIVDEDALNQRGIECVKVYGRRVKNDHGVATGMKYDSTALLQALEMVMGRKTAMTRSRRNTMTAQ